VADAAIAVNGAFVGQRVTGQQRYAREITDRLVQRDDVELVVPSEATRDSSLRSWLWALGPLPLVTRRKTLLSLTSRAPLRHPRHVVVVHDLFVLTDPQWYSSRYVATHAPALRTTLRSAAHVVTVSQPVADQVLASGLTTAPVSVAPNAPSVVFGRDPAVRPLPLGLREGEFLLVVGSLDPRKNLPTLLSAYATLPPEVRRRVPLVVVGGSSAVYRQARLDPVEGVVLAGYLDDETLSSLYSRARGVVFPSFAEGFGLPLVEAALAGARVAASDIPVFRWIAGDHPVYFDPHERDSVADALKVLLEEDPVVGTAFAEAVTSRFSWDSSAAVVGEACRSVSGTHG